jgi:hypothetical protein
MYIILYFGARFFWGKTFLIKIYFDIKIVYFPSLGFHIYECNLDWFVRLLGEAQPLCFQ